MKLCKGIFDVSDDDLTRIDTVAGPLYMKRFIKEPACNMVIEDFKPGQEITWWFWHDEIHYIITGKAEVTYSLPGLHLKSERATIEAGDAYLIYRGERITWKVISKEPYRKFCVVMPAIPLPSGDHLIQEHYEKHVPLGTD
jgi:quercetin dioxygenase-like cupin family protein